MIKHLTPKTEKEMNVFLKDVHFKKYYKKTVEPFKNCAKRDNISLKEFIKTRLKKTLLEHKISIYRRYESKECHSFWRSECENKNIECHRCREFYSQKDKNVDKALNTKT